VLEAFWFQKELDKESKWMIQTYFHQILSITSRLIFIDKKFVDDYIS